MKIRNKLLLSNIFITIFSMIILSVFLGSFFSNYIEGDIKEDLAKINREIILLIEYGKIDITSDKIIKGNYDYFSNYSYLPSISFIVDLETSELFEFYEKDYKEIKQNKFDQTFEIENILNKQTDEFYTINISDKPYLAYNSTLDVTIEGEDFSLLIFSMIYRGEIVKIINSILIIVLVGIIIASIIIIILNRYFEKTLTKPIKTLVNVTEKISRRQFDEKVRLKTKDEFEYLGNAINSMSEKLKKQDIEQKKFYENVSHDIKTPLTVISGYAQGVKTKIFENPDESLDKIVNECNKLKNQLEDVIFLSKLDTIKETDYFKKCCLNELISDSLDNLDSLIILKEIDIIFEPKEEIYIKADKKKFKKALINILSNCIKYTRDSIYIKIIKKKKNIEINISDNGNGFANKILYNAFDRTFIGEKGGTGIGLSIIKRVIEDHDGEIKLFNKPEGGASYSILIPYLS